jgi:hypothetical protein
MKIKFKQDTELEVVIDIDGDDEPILMNETFKAGEVHDVDVLEEREYSDDGECEMDIQFGDGCCVFNLPSEFVETIEK